MTDIIATTQQQEVDSGILYLFDIEISSGDYEHFYDGDTPLAFDGNIYNPLPLELEGMELSADGSYSRPTLRLSNINNFLYNELETMGGLESLIGKRVIQRTTFEKYLSSNPAVEYPKVAYVIDRINSRNVISIELELAAPFDLANINLPRRQVLNGSCPWVYKGRNGSNPTGGCNWDPYLNNASYPTFVDIRNNYVVNQTLLSSLAEVLTTSQPKVLYQLYTTTNSTAPGVVPATSKTLVNADGTYTENIRVDRYWVCTKAAGATEYPWTSPNSFVEYRPYTTYNSNSYYRVFTDSVYSDIVLYNQQIWKPKTVSTVPSSPHSSTPSINRFWSTADKCSKTLDACTKRFITGLDGDNLVSPESRLNTLIPFGGFPGASRNNG